MENIKDDPHSQAYRSEMVSARVVKTPKNCSYCPGRLQRRKRQGFVEHVIMPYFGKYPWKCNVCGRVQFYKDRR